MGIKQTKICDISQKEILEPSNPVVVKIYPSTTRDGTVNIIEVIGSGRIKTTELETLLSREGLLSAMGLPPYQELIRLIKNEREEQELRNQRTDR